jgi:hypothetical protein
MYEREREREKKRVHKRKGEREREKKSQCNTYFVKASWHLLFSFREDKNKL